MAHPHTPSQAIRLPFQAPRRQPRLARRRAIRLLAGALFLAALPATASEPLPGADVASLHAWLTGHNPELRALTLEAEAAQARIQPAGALPDPTLSLRLAGLDAGRPWRDAGMGSETTVSVRQPLPLWGKRDLARTSARQDADASGFDRDAALRDLFAQAESALVRYWHADMAIAVLDRRIALLAQIGEIARVRYALGAAAQQDAIRAQVEQTRLRRERIERTAIRRETKAALNAVLGRSADAPLATPAGVPILPIASPPAPGTQSLANHPAVLAQEARAEAARTRAELQRRKRLPDLTVGIGTMRQRGGPDGMELMLEVEIPFQQRARREREREARLLAEAALARGNSVLQELQARDAMARAQWRSARDRRELTEGTLLPQADATWQSALASYQVGEVDFGTLLEALNEWQGADLDRVDALRDELLGAAAVRAIEGEAR